MCVCDTTSRAAGFRFGFRFGFRQRPDTRRNKSAGRTQTPTGQWGPGRRPFWPPYRHLRSTGSLERHFLLFGPRLAKKTLCGRAPPIWGPNLFCSPEIIGQFLVETQKISIKLKQRAANEVKQVRPRASANLLISGGGRARPGGGPVGPERGHIGAAAAK